MTTAELIQNIRSVDLPCTLRMYGVTEEQFDELTDEDTKAYLLDGVMVVQSPASVRHDYVVGFLISVMRTYAEEKELGGVFGPDSLFRLASGRRFASDLYFLLPDQIPDPLPKVFDVVPPLVLEVLSPSNRDDDLYDKRPAYQEAGVKEIWLVDYEKKKILIDRRKRKRYVTETITAGKAASSVVDGFWIEAEWLWESELPKVLQTVQKILK